MINRYGFPSDGAASVLSRLKSRLPQVFGSDGNSYLPLPPHASLRSNALLAINLGKNKTSPADSTEDFAKGVRAFAPYADVLVVNVSSPNTPGLRSMQNREVLQGLLNTVTSEAEKSVSIAGRRPRVVLKIAPDLDEDALRDIAAAVTSTKGVDGIIVSNTTIQRPSSLSPLSSSIAQTQTGGLSGRPLKPLSLRTLRTIRGFLPESITLIGCGGISTGEDCLEYAKAGASFVQIYTSFGYDGVGAARRIKDELAALLEKERTTWQEVVAQATKELSQKRQEHDDEKETLIGREDGEGGLKTLIDEATAIKHQLDILAERFGEKMQDAARATEIPNPAM